MWNLNFIAMFYCMLVWGWFREFAISTIHFLEVSNITLDTAYRKIQEEIFNNLSAEELKKELEKESRV